jgi:hypothetical protein
MDGKNIVMFAPDGVGRLIWIKRSCGNLRSATVWMAGWLSDCRAGKVPRTARQLAMSARLLLRCMSRELADFVAKVR